MSEQTSSPRSESVVYVLVPGGYDEYGFDAVYATLEAAQAARPEDQWISPEDGYWHNGKDAIGGTRYEIHRAEVKS
jgi:hypothetical protein